MTLADLAMLVLGVGVGLWFVIEPLRESNGMTDDDFWVILGGGVLGGASMIGVPLLLWERRRRPGRRWGPGRLLWFAHGTAAWLLWPPAIPARLRPSAKGQPPVIDPDLSQICFFYGTPLMAVYVTLALLAGGWLRRRRRRRRLRGQGWSDRRRGSWHERFGLWLVLAWAVIGLYVLGMIYTGSIH